MSRRFPILIATLGSIFLLAAAYGFQFMGYPPCHLCWWQRYPHFAAIAIGLLALGIGGRWLPALGALAMVATAGVGLFHTGVERGWWEGPVSCTGTGQSLGSLSGSDLLSTTAAPRVIMCDQVSWEMLGLSMASWNMLASLVLLAFWIRAIQRS